MTDKHSWEMDLKRYGDHGIRRIGEDGRETIRGLEIPTGSSFAQRAGKIIDAKQKKARSKK